MAYTGTTTLDFPAARRVTGLLWVLNGIYDLTTYDTTGVEITAITNEFSRIFRVVSEGVSDNLYLVRWDTTDKCFHAFYPFYSTAAVDDLGADNVLCAAVGGPAEVDGSGTAYGQPAVECANAVDVGVINFTAFGIR